MLFIIMRVAVFVMSFVNSERNELFSRNKEGIICCRIHCTEYTPAPQQVSVVYIENTMGVICRAMNVGRITIYHITGVLFFPNLPTNGIIGVLF